MTSWAKAIHRPRPTSATRIMPLISDPLVKAVRAQQAKPHTGLAQLDKVLARLPLAVRALDAHGVHVVPPLALLFEHEQLCAHRSAEGHDRPFVNASDHRAKCSQATYRLGRLDEDLGPTQLPLLPVDLHLGEHVLDALLHRAVPPRERLRRQDGKPK